MHLSTYFTLCSPHTVGTGGGKGKSSKSGKKTLAKRTRSASSMSEFLTSSRDDSKNQQLAGT